MKDRESMVKEGRGNEQTKNQEVTHSSLWWLNLTSRKLDLTQIIFFISD